MSALERRRAPRIVKRVRMALAHESWDVTTKTENLSVSGAYCAVSRFVAPMTKVQVRLDLSNRAKPSSILCEGVVVRVDPPTPTLRRSRYKVAIFFSAISERHRAALTRYVQQHFQGAPGRR